VTAGSTRGEHFRLFSYRTFFLPDSDIDPVVVGVTFTETDKGVNVEVDVSGEQTGDLISPSTNWTVPDSRDELLAAAIESAQELGQAVNVITAAIKNQSRIVE
jgi:hypothetical protein